MENYLYGNRCDGIDKTVTLSVTTKRQKQKPEASHCGLAVDFLNGYFPVISCLLQMKRYLLMMLKEQSPCPSVLLGQTKPEGLPEGFEPTKHKGKGIVPIITHGRFCWVQQTARC